MNWLNWTEVDNDDDGTDLTQVDSSVYMMPDDLTQPTKFDDKVDQDTVANLRNQKAIDALRASQ